MDTLRERLAASDSGPQYWRSLDELADTEAFGDYLHSEFPRWAPIWQQAVDRRSVLKLMAASMALTGVTACDRAPAGKIVPYVNMPESVTLGQVSQYATAAAVGGYAHGILAESREGRPIKIEGNPDHPATHGSCDVFSQASVLSLYDPDRSDTVRRVGEISTFPAFLIALQAHRTQWDDSGGDGLCLLTGKLTSPSQIAAIEAMRQRWPAMRWFVHEPGDSAAPIAGARMAFGRAVEPRYHFDKAQVVCSLDADFLGLLPGYLHYARDFVSLRRLREEQPNMNRLYSIDATPSITSAAADHRQRVPGDRLEGVARALASELGIAVDAGSEMAVDRQWLQALAQDLQAHQGEALVLAGPHLPPAVQALVYAINEALQAPGRTVEYQEPVAVGHEADGLADLSKAIDAGQVDTLLMLDCNPVYTAAGDLDFPTRLQTVPLRIHWGLYFDESAHYAHWHVPATHALEAWGDMRAFEGTASLVQPLITPLYHGRTALQMLHAITAGEETDARALLRGFWRKQRPDTFDQQWTRWLQQGVVPDTAAAVVDVSMVEDWQTRLPESQPPEEGLLLQFRVDPSVWDGHHANNGWLQELPKPLTKLTWGNAALLSPALAQKHKLREGDVIRLTVAQRSLEAPVYVLPGQPDNAVTLNLGYGRSAAGQVGNGVGVNAYLLRSSAAPWLLPGLTIEATGAHRQLATTQNHRATEGRDQIRVADLATFKDKPQFAQKDEDTPQESLYPEPYVRNRLSAYQWGMSIDLNACIGCNACITACQSENNIPIVGEAEVARGHEMHWIRVDRYFEGQPEAPRLVFQPVPCMHCENAPCEYVCPTGATQHSADGLNQMVYNRCIGTRDCSQNCPYKVRAFNWFLYNGPKARHPTPPPVQNPSVTVRARGVMEKCTYCVQRIQAAKIEHAKTDEPIRDGEIVTACQQACPTDAIVFGDISDDTTQVARTKRSPRNYAMLGNLNTRPRTTYLAAVRNPNPAIEELERGPQYREMGHATD
ncbi:MAG TPA: TAT-variant-translocated molybdopterin oxidoreductase [Salinisphaeraceae bacterium]|nr:TAT-variant-translocated molybdopterin oxidoreductase [Salinisphaeraceae bacterium]